MQLFYKNFYVLHIKLSCLCFFFPFCPFLSTLTDFTLYRVRVQVIEVDGVSGKDRQDIEC